VAQARKPSLDVAAGWTARARGHGSSLMDVGSVTKRHLKSPFTQRKRRVDLELVQTRTFSSRVVYFRYRVAR
jgi:hypothetical protein